MKIEKHKSSMWAILVVAGCVALGCNEDSSSQGPGEAGVPQHIQQQHALVRMDSCDQFIAYAREAALHRLQTQAAQQRLEFENCTAARKGEGGEMPWVANETTGTEDTGASVGAPAASDADGDADFSGSESADGSGASGGDKEYSQTNVQEKGVDEADIIKTDGDYLYALSGGEFVIVRAGDNGALSQAGRLSLGGSATELFLLKEQKLAVVFLSPAAEDVPEALQPAQPSWQQGGGTSTGAAEPAMDMEMAYYAPYGFTEVAIVDVSAVNAPKVIRKIVYSGTYVTARLVGTSLRAVISSPVTTFDFPFYLDVYNYCQMPEEVGRRVFDDASDAMVSEYTKLIETVAVKDVLPMKLDSASGTPEPIVGCGEIYGPKTQEGTGFLTVVSLDLTAPLEPQTDVGIFGQQGLVYASPSSLYLTTARDYAMLAFETGLWANETSGVHKFDIATDPGKAIYKATGEVEGRMLNQFCLGEYTVDDKPFLRVATSTGSRWDISGENTLDNRISVLEEKGGRLDLVGELTGIGSGEEIQSARFLGPRGFMVTFLQTDPLFTFDLSDPYKPVKEGEWLGPGFSTYLHPYGENHLIAVGQENGQFVLSLYDLTDFAHPALVDRYDFSNLPGIQSAALYEHKAFNFDEANGILALPFELWSYDEITYMGSRNTGIAVLDVELGGFAAAGEMNLIPGGDPNGTESAAERSVFIGDTLFGISRCRITSAPLADPSAVSDTLKLYTGEYCNQYYGGYYGLDDVKPGTDLPVAVDAGGAEAL